MNTLQRFRVYKQARTYGAILSDVTLEGPTRLMVILYEGRRYNVCLFQGEVFALTIEG